MGDDYDLRRTARPQAVGSHGRAPSVCIYGVYGKGNLGDEALLAAIAEDVRSLRPDVRLTAFCSSPANVARDHGIDAVCRKPLRHFYRKLRAIARADLFVIGGGTLLRDSGRRRDDIAILGSAIFWPLVAKLAGVPVVALGSGVGSARRAIMRTGIRQFFSRVDAVAFRDADSASRFGRLKGRGRFQVTCDPVASSPLFDAEAIERRASPGILAARGRAAPYAVLAIRRPEWQALDNGSDYFHACASATAALARETDARIVLFPVQLSPDFPDDRGPAAILAKMLASEGVPESRIYTLTWERIEDGAAILQGADLVVSDRLHALLIAAKAGVACVGTSTVDKIAGCLRMIGTSDAISAVDVASVGAAPLAAALLAAWHARDDERPAIAERVRRWGNAAPNNALLRRYLEPARQPRGRRPESRLGIRSVSSPASPEAARARAEPRDSDRSAP